MALQQQTTKLKIFPSHSDTRQSMTGIVILFGIPLFTEGYSRRTFSSRFIRLFEIKRDSLKKDHNITGRTRSASDLETRRGNERPALAAIKSK
jgi:hypothetical protein